MTWNWQQKNWPLFEYDPDEFLDYEQEFLQKSGIIQGSLKHISGDDQDMLKVQLMSEEAFTTSEIEGELLSRDSLQSSIRRQFGLHTDHRKITPAEQGIAEMMVHVYSTFSAPLDHDVLFHWHALLMNGRRDIQSGAYRTHPEPMQIVSGPMGYSTVHFEAPPSERMEQEMQRYLDWFNKIPTDKGKALYGLVRSGIAHLYFESIHPFEDGNGRIGRALSEKALSQSLGRPTLVAISATIAEDKKAYYSALHRASTGLNITQWLHYFCKMVLKAQERSQRIIDFLIWKARFYQIYSQQFNERQAKAVARIFREGISGFKGGLSAENYIRITGASRATATRDLQQLVEIGAFDKTGELRHTRYWLTIKNDQQGSTQK